MKENDDFRITAVCAECGSPFRRAASGMKELCPECASVLYGCENCPHVFQDGRCIRCLWNGNRSDYVKQLLLR